MITLDGSRRAGSGLTRAIAGLLLTAAAVLPASAADMTNDRAVNVDKEPGNWLLHHKDYAAHRFSSLDQINASNVRNLHVAFVVGLGGFESGGRYAFGNLEGTDRKSVV